MISGRGGLMHTGGNERLTQPYIGRIFSGDRDNGSRPITLILQGTNFQIKVWEALLKIPMGSVVPYQDLAAKVCSARAARAVGSAIGRNPIAFLIPCHRVIRKAGGIGGYHWGSTRKKSHTGVGGSPRAKHFLSFVRNKHLHPLRFPSGC